MPTVIFQPAGVTVDVAEGQSLLEAAHTHGVELRTTCGGKASCRDCRIVVVSGDEALNPVSFAEERVLGNTYFITRERLACQTRVLRDGAVVKIPQPRTPVTKPQRPLPHRAGQRPPYKREP